jgi:hypothetical protein
MEIAFRDTGDKLDLPGIDIRSKLQHQSTHHGRFCKQVTYPFAGKQRINLYMQKIIL